MMCDCLMETSRSLSLSLRYVFVPVLSTVSLVLGGFTYIVCSILQISESYPISLFSISTDVIKFDKMLFRKSYSSSWHSNSDIAQLSDKPPTLSAENKMSITQNSRFSFRF